MKILEKTEVFKLLCKLSKKFGMYIMFGEDEDWGEVIKAAPYLTLDNYQTLMEGRAIILFDNEEEMLDCYEKTVGDDGPTKKNQYVGKVRVYAVTCSSEGELLNENT